MPVNSGNLLCRRYRALRHGSARPTLLLYVGPLGLCFCYARWLLVVHNAGSVSHCSVALTWLIQTILLPKYARMLCISIWRLGLFLAQPRLLTHHSFQQYTGTYHADTTWYLWRHSLLLLLLNKYCKHFREAVMEITISWTVFRVLQTTWILVECTIVKFNACFLQCDIIWIWWHFQDTVYYAHLCVPERVCFAVLSKTVIRWMTALSLFIAF